MGVSVDAIRGAFTIAFTPFDENGEVDYSEFAHQIDYLASSGADGVVLYGMTSEYHKLNDEETQSLAELFLSCMQRHPGVVSVLNVTEWSTELAIKTARKYESMGVDAIMIMPPFYYAPSAKMVKKHIISVLEAVSCPVLVQYAPLATRFTMPPEELADISESYPNCIYKAEYRPAVPFVEELFRAKADMPIMTGWAGLDLIEQYRRGVRGVVTVGGYTEVFVEIFKAIDSGDIRRATEIYDRMYPYIDKWMVNPESLLAIEKEILYRRGIAKNAVCRHPCYELTDENSREIDAFLQQFNDILN